MSDESQPIKAPRIHEDMKPGEGPYWRLEKTKKGDDAAGVFCWFHHRMALGHHTVLDDGMLDPPILECDEPKCTFRGRVRLVGWQYRNRPLKKREEKPTEKQKDEEQEEEGAGA